MKTKILAIAPYQGMKEIMREISEQREDMDVTIDIGDLDSGLEIVESYDLDEFDAIISRGGTAKLIASHVSIPVTEVELSIYDILRAMKMAQTYTSHFAILGYPAITDCARTLCSLMKYDIEIVTIYKEDDAYEGMRQLASRGYEMVLCDMIGTSAAYEYGLNSILITSSRESIEAAFDQAAKTAHFIAQLRNKTLIMKAALIQSRESVFVYTKAGEFILSSMKRTSVTEEFFTFVNENLSLFLTEPHYRTERRNGSLVYTLYTRHITIRETGYVYIYLNLQDAPELVEDIGISVYEKSPNDTDASPDFYGSSTFVGDTRLRLEQYSSNLCPILILGERGTGKDSAASYLYQHSEYRRKPFFIIDCEHTNQKKWNYLMENINSPLNDLHTTIYIKNVQQLDTELADFFFTYLKQNDCCRRNRYIFSFTLDNEHTEEDSRVYFMKNRLSCLVLPIMPLRERVEDIPTIAMLYISRTNMELGKQVVGFNPDAMELMKNFIWSQNLDQFKRVIQELCVMTEGYYIDAELVEKILKQENPRINSSAAPGYEAINLEQTLDDINYDIARIVLQRNGMNKTKAVKRLGISRTTLWRMLRRSK